MTVKQLEIRSSLFRKGNSLFPLGSAAFWGCMPKMDIGRKRDGTGSVDLCARGGFLRGLSVSSACNRNSYQHRPHRCTAACVPGSSCKVEAGRGFVPGP